jgi:hypothetical protein
VRAASTSLPGPFGWLMSRWESSRFPCEQFCFFVTGQLKGDCILVKTDCDVDST